MNSSNIIALADHVWQSTLFAVVVGCLALLLRRNTARVRYLLWLAASAKFLVPFALLTAMGAQISRVLGPLNVPELDLLSISGQMAVQVTEFGAAGAKTVAQVAHSAKDGEFVLIAFGVLWALGTFVVIVRWFTQWRVVRRAVRESTETNLSFVIPVRSSSSRFEPAVAGVLRPVLLLPEGLECRLTPEEMRAVLAHERCHVAWGDNFAATMHMIVQAVFWIHPLVWWLGMRIVDERERACDERVLAEGHSSESYAEGILKVCEHYLEYRHSCVASISGAHLKRRIEDIKENRPVARIGVIRKLVIAQAACVTIAVPVVIGVLTSSHMLPTEVAMVAHKPFVIEARRDAPTTTIDSGQVLSAQFHETHKAIPKRHRLIASPSGAAKTAQPEDSVSAAVPAPRPTMSVRLEVKSAPIQIDFAPPRLAPETPQIAPAALLNNQLPPGGYRRVVVKGQERFCRNEPHTGSLAEKNPVCLTEAQWQTQQDQARQYIVDVQRSDSVIRSSRAMNTAGAVW